MVEKRTDSAERSTAPQVEFDACEAPLGAGRAAASESDLLARMSHEMRTPLSAILGFTQLMESGKPAPTVLQKRNIELILQAGWYLEKLINMTHDLALIDSGSLAVSLETVPLAAVMRDVEALIGPQADMRGVRVTFPRFESPCFVSADRIRLQQVFVNLLSGAIECSEAGGAFAVNCVTLGPERFRIAIAAGEGPSTQSLTRLSRQFDGLVPDAAPVAGTTISLLLAARLIELMGGAIGAQNPVGPRTVFAFDLQRLHVPLHSGETGIPGEGRPQGRVQPPDNHSRPCP
jgi:signal transduction histidine kinase